MKLKYNLYYFQVHNMVETLQGARPQLVQQGPYAFDEFYVKFDIEFSDDGDTVTFNTQKYYVFNQEETGPGLLINDQIVVPYACVVGFEYLLSEVPVAANELLDAALDVSCSFRCLCFILYFAWICFGFATLVATVFL